MSNRHPHRQPRAGRDLRPRAASASLFRGTAYRQQAACRSCAKELHGLAKDRYDLHLRSCATTPTFHNGRQMTADDIIWSYHPHHGRLARAPRRALCRPCIKGAVDVEKGAGQGDLGPQEDRRFHARDDADRPKTDPGFLLLHRHDRDLSGQEAQQADYFNKPIGLGPYKFTEHVPGSRMVVDKLGEVLQAGQAYADKVVISLMGEAGARDVAFRNKEIDVSDSRPDAICRLSRRSEPVEGPARGRRGLYPRHGHEPDLQALRRQARAPGDQLRDRRRPDHQAPGPRQGLSRLGLAAALAPRFDKDKKPYPYDPEKARSCWSRPAIRTGSSSNGPRPRTRLGHPDRRGHHPDAGQGRRQGEDQAGGGHGAVEVDPQGRVSRPISGRPPPAPIRSPR